MRVKKEAETAIIFICIVLFFSIGSYIGVKELKEGKSVDAEKVWESTIGADDINEEPKEAVEEAPIEIKENIKIIEINDTMFFPSSLHISVGDTVFWVNKDSKRAYQVYDKSAKQAFNSFRLMPFNSYNYTFNEPGTYYFGDSTFKYMRGVIIVE